VPDELRAQSEATHEVHRATGDEHDRTAEVLVIESLRAGVTEQWSGRQRE
jgi:hypothetical protein